MRSLVSIRQLEPSFPATRRRLTHVKSVAPACAAERVASDPGWDADGLVAFLACGEDVGEFRFCRARDDGKKQKRCHNAEAPERDVLLAGHLL